MKSVPNYDHAHNDLLTKLDLEADDFSHGEITTVISRRFSSISRGVDSIEIPNLVKFYFDIEDLRINLFQYTGGKNEEIFKAYSSYLKGIESSVTPMIKDYNYKSVTGNWSLMQEGIGQATAAALLSMIDVNKAPNVNSVWRYCGLDPKQTEPGSWNPFLKSLTWKIGKAFAVYPDSFYGQLYAKELKRRTELNKSGSYSDDVPDARLQAQARRYATKIFLSHWYQIRHQEVTGIFPTNLINSASYIAPPNNPF